MLDVSEFLNLAWELRKLREMRAEAAAELLRGNKAALVRHLAIQQLIDERQAELSGPVEIGPR